MNPINFGNESIEYPEVSDLNELYMLLIFFIAFLNSSSPEVQLNSPNWLLDYETALSECKEGDKTILMVFSGSDWCKPCILLRNKLFQIKKFEDLADQKLVLLEVDFPASRKNRLSKEQKTHNEGLAERFNSNGIFPLVIALNSEGNVLGSFGYEPDWSAQNYLDQIEKLCDH